MGVEVEQEVSEVLDEIWRCRHTATRSLTQTGC
jgi:hypothetical protein